MKKFLEISTDTHGVASVTLNRPEVHNAFNAELIAELTQVFTELDKNDKVRLAVLSGNGKSFCAGGDLNWMREAKNFSYEENIEDSRKLAAMFHTLYQFGKPLIGMVHGKALGGGTGLAAVCDFVLATEDAEFGLTEARLGLIPSVISPYVIEKIGIGNARAYFLSGSRISAAIAQRIGLVHDIVPASEWDAARKERINEFLLAAPEAARNSKALIREVTGFLRAGDWEGVQDFTIKTIAKRRTSAEGQEGMQALLEKRKPKWVEE